jgi:DNA-binding response OmpR family regulator
MPRQIHIVDDDPVAALITQRGLQTLLGDRYSVIVDPNPNAAWMACASNNVDLLIVDPSPHVSGVLPLLRAVRTFRPLVPVLVLTAYDTPGLRAKVRDLGVDRDRYVPKPVDLQELLPIVSAALAAAPVRPQPGPSLSNLSIAGLCAGK